MAYDMGMIGLAVMGENLVLNIESKGFSIIGYDISLERMNQFKHDRANGKQIGFASSLDDMIQQLERPRTIMMMIRAGEPVDLVIEQLIPLLDKGDIIIDGGNSNFHDTIRRFKTLQDSGLFFIGAGVSGGEEGALNGPSIMPGGSSEAWVYVKPILQAIAARTDEGDVCCEWVGTDGSGHFVKMVHNGIEYGDIQLITEAYHLMRDLLGMSADEMADVFDEWNQEELNSYLIGITAEILRKKDTDGAPLVDKILDTAGQKGTGKWTAITSLNEGVPLSLIGEAVFARALSAQKTERVVAANLYARKIPPFTGNKESFLLQLKHALYAAKLISYTQGFALMRVAASSHKWDLKYGDIALMWRGGCIIRSAFLGDIKKAFTTNPDLENLLLDPFFQKGIEQRLTDWRQVVSTAILYGVPIPALSIGLSYFDGYTTANLPANLLQAMRDYFGAHTYERIDKERGEYFHTNWTGKGGTTSSTTYDS